MNSPMKPILGNIQSWTPSFKKNTKNDHKKYQFVKGKNEANGSLFTCILTLFFLWGTPGCLQTSESPAYLQLFSHFGLWLDLPMLLLQLCWKWQLASRIALCLSVCYLKQRILLLNQYRFISIDLLPKYKVGKYKDKYSYQIESKGISHYNAPPANSISYIIN